MKKKNSMIFSVFIGLLAILVGIYWFYFSEPSSFPTEVDIRNDIQQVLPEAAVELIQDTIFVDEKHVVVPFISKNKKHGLSYWIWKTHKWKVVLVDVGGEPKIWKVDPQNVSSYTFVWNLSTVDELSSLQLYMIRERGFSISEEMEAYSPRVQMEWEVSLANSTYGVMKLPQEGAKVLNASIISNKAESNVLFTGFFHADQGVFFNWITREASGNESYPENSVNGTSAYLGEITVDYIMSTSEEQLEYPKSNLKRE